MTQIIIDIETNGLKSIENVISCISFLKDGVLITFVGENEKEILTKFWNQIEIGDVLIGYNSDDFDLPFIIKRSIINIIKVKRVISLDLRKKVNSFFTSYNKLDSGKLDDWAKILGMNDKPENGLKVIEYYENKEWSKIKEHCEYDVLITEKLLERCKECNIL